LRRLRVAVRGQIGYRDPGGDRAMKSLLAYSLILAATVASSGAVAAESLQLDSGALNVPKSSTSQVSDTSGANLKTEDENYQKICDAFGEGFVYSAGGVCLKIGGFVKVGTSIGHGPGY
jgi:hypothetical protein